MKHFYLIFLISLSLFIPLQNVWSYPQQSGWVRDPITGQSVSGAWIQVVDRDSSAKASLYGDSTLQTQLSNPLQADQNGFYTFFIESGKYKISYLRNPIQDQNAIFDVFQVNLIDPIGEKTVYSNRQAPAITFDHLRSDYDINQHYVTTSFRFERQNNLGIIQGGPWFFSGFRAEMGMDWNFNTFGHYLGTPAVPLLPGGAVLAQNTADNGNFNSFIQVDYHGGGIISSGTGAWLAPSAGQTINVDFAIAGTGVTAQSVVVLSPNQANSITLSTHVAQQAPLVVTQIQNFQGIDRAIVAVAGISSVRALGPVNVGDPLVSSAVPGVAQSGVGASAPKTFGTAMSSLALGQTGSVQFKVGMVRTQGK